jgi:hypothetical protein
MSEGQPEIHITLWGVHLRGEPALKAAGWIIRPMILCRIIAPPWLLYLLVRFWLG